jgi:Alginate lyase
MVTKYISKKTPVTILIASICVALQLNAHAVVVQGGQKAAATMQNAKEQQKIAVRGSTSAVCQGVEGYAADFQGRRTFLWRPDALQTTATGWRAGVKNEAVEAVIADANAAMREGPWRVTDKTRAPESGDLHDYASMGPYWWPDPKQKDGLPYLRRDGEINPERDGQAFDLKRMEAMSSAVEALALAYFLTEDRAYADHAAMLLRVWFLDPKTRMNPNMDHAQSIPGRVPGRAEGIIDLRHLMLVVEAIGLLEPSRALLDNEVAALRDWYSELVGWMATNPLGREERAAKNNHALFYDLIITHFALFSGHEDVAKLVLNRFPEQRIQTQFAADGSLPAELTRTRSFHYSTWTMAAVYDLASLGECFNIDLWSYQDSEGRGLRSAATFLSSYAGKESTWRWPEQKMETLFFYGALRRAARAYQDRDLWLQSEQYRERYRKHRMNLLFPMPKDLPSPKS